MKLNSATISSPSNSPAPSAKSPSEFKPPKAFKDGVQFAWDSTSIKLSQECMRKYQYKMILGWTFIGDAPHLRFGAAYATALEHFHKHLADGLSRNDALINVVFEALESTWDREGERPGPWQSSHHLKTRENLIRTIVWYVDQFADDSAKTIINQGRPAVEYSFTLPVDHDIIFTGHIDRLVEYQGDIYVTDQKTTGSTLSARYFDQFSPDTQMSMYTFAGKIIYNMPVSGVIIDAAQIAVGFSRFERGITVRSAGQLEEWYGETLTQIRQAQKMTEAEYFPMNPTACGNYGGCPFRPICSRDPKVRPQFLEGNYVKGPRWDPLDRR